MVDYAFSAASLVLPQVLGALDVEAVASHAYVSERRQAGETATLAESLGQTKRLVEAVGADLGAVLDPAAERIFLVDDKAREVPVEQELLLFLRLLASDGKKGRLAFPTTVTSLVDELVQGTDLQVERTPHSLSGLTAAAAGDGVIFAGSVGGASSSRSSSPPTTAWRASASCSSSSRRCDARSRRSSASSPSPLSSTTRCAAPGPGRARSCGS